MSRYDLTDFEWLAIEPVLPRKSRGVPWVDDRRVLSGIVHVLKNGDWLRPISCCVKLTGNVKRENPDWSAGCRAEFWGGVAPLFNFGCSLDFMRFRLEGAGNAWHGHKSLHFSNVFLGITGGL